MSTAQSILQFHRLIDQARLPQRADRSAAGTLPTRAYRYCEPVTTATGFGWWVFPPMDFQLIWDGQDIYWHFGDAPDWLPLASSVQFPGFAGVFDAAAPESLKGCSPPFLTALPESGLVQIWTGIMMRSAPDWSVLVRGPANLATPGGYSVFEGIIETDTWYGPLFTNLRLTQTHRPVHIRADFPLLQVQPLPRNAYAEQTLNATNLVTEMAALRDEDWDAYYRNIVVRTQDADRDFGAYAVASRKRRRGACPFSGAEAR